MVDWDHRSTGRTPALQAGDQGSSPCGSTVNASECWQKHSWLPTRWRGCDSRRTLRLDALHLAMASGCNPECGEGRTHARLQCPRGPTEGRRSSKPRGGGSNPSGGANSYPRSSKEGHSATNREVGGSSPPVGAISSPFKPGDPLFNRSPGHREVIGASPFWRRVAGMRDRRDRDRDLRVRSGEWTRAFAGARSLSPSPFWAETEEREPGARLTETETRFTDGEKIQTRLHRRARPGDVCGAS